MHIDRVGIQDDRMPWSLVIQPLQSIGAHPKFTGGNRPHRSVIFLNGMSLFLRFSESFELRGDRNGSSQDGQECEGNKKELSAGAPVRFHPTPPVPCA